jgi:hypothetical protein
MAIFCDKELVILSPDNVLADHAIFMTTHDIDMAVGGKIKRVSVQSCFCAVKLFS